MPATVYCIACAAAGRPSRRVWRQCDCAGGCARGAAVCGCHRVSIGAPFFCPECRANKCSRKRCNCHLAAPQACRSHPAAG